MNRPVQDPATTVGTSALAESPDQQPTLELVGVSAGYGDVTVLRDVSLRVPTGSIVALVGPNGAGKTTLLNVAAGLRRPASGQVIFEGADVTRRPAEARAQQGLCLIPEGRGIFRQLTVEENLRLFRIRKAGRAEVDEAYEQFPILKERRQQVAGTLSGGQQQMVALARAYLCSPRCILIDEISMGLAPIVVDEMFDALRRLASRNVSLLIVEQYIHRVLEIADHVVVLNKGMLELSGTPAELNEDAIARNYLGVTVDA